MQKRTVLIVGTGRCGLRSLAESLNRQPDTRISAAEPPLLPWRCAEPGRLLRERLARLRRTRPQAVVGDAAPFYLPYLETALDEHPDLRVVGLRRPREEVVGSFARSLDAAGPPRINHWADEPAEGWSHDVLWSASFPQYDTADRAEGLRRYADEYARRLANLAERHPDRLRLFDMHETLNSEPRQRAVLDFLGYGRDIQVLAVGLRAEPPHPTHPRPRMRRSAAAPSDPGRCVVLVPYVGFIHPGCEQALRALERRGYPVRRVGGFAAIDQGRSQLATDALIDGYEETLWIDSDIEFHPDAVDRLRSHGLPLCCGVYPQKGRRALACHVLPGTAQMVFGQAGGLQEILYAGAGFLHVRREVYLRMRHRLALPLANERFGVPLVPFFEPMLLPVEDGRWYLAEDYAFCERARRCGYRVMADTSVRLWHVGAYPYGWEDSGTERERAASFTLRFPDPPPA